MKRWMRTGLGLAALLPLLGCAQGRPCQIIPMQLKLASHELQQARSDVDSKQADVDRTQENLDLARTRLQQLRDEQAELEQRIAGQVSGGGK